MAMVACQQLTLSLALPQIAANLRATAGDLQWIIGIFPIGLAALLVPAGALGDRWGRRRMLLVGLAIMSGTNVGIALSHSPSPVITWRALCSIGGALAFPATLSSLTSAFADQAWAKAVAFWSIAASFGAFAGLFGAGGLMRFWSWRSNCWTSAALGLILLCAVAALVRESRSHERITLVQMNRSGVAGRPPPGIRPPTSAGSLVPKPCTHVKLSSHPPKFCERGSAR